MGSVASEISNEERWRCAQAGPLSEWGLHLCFLEYSECCCGCSVLLRLGGGMITFNILYFPWSPLVWEVFASYIVSFPLSFSLCHWPRYTHHPGEEMSKLLCVYLVSSCFCGVSCAPLLLAFCPQWAAHMYLGSPHFQKWACCNPLLAFPMSLHRILKLNCMHAN